MGLATIDLLSLKEHIKIHKMLKFTLNRPNSEQDTAIWKCQNIKTAGRGRTARYKFLF